MWSELTVHTAGGACRVFLQDGFDPARVPAPRLHRHHYTEIHVIAGGGALFRLGESDVPLAAGGMLAVPAGTPHCCVSLADGTRHSAFQTERVCGEAFLDRTDGAAEGFFAEIARWLDTGNAAGIAAYLALFCDRLPGARPLAAAPITDYAFLIREFFSLHYGDDVRLGELAAVLHLSERQAERAVVRLTGHGFREELRAVRCEQARLLAAAGTLPLGAIAGYVGYASYAGFWKAMRQENKKRMSKAAPCR